MSRLGTNLRQSIRQLLRRPGQTALAVVTLGLGIGFVTALFSVIDGTVLRGLSFKDAERVVRLERRSLGQGGIWMEEVEAWREDQSSLEVFSVWMGTSGALSGDGRSADYRIGAYVYPGFFAGVGVLPAFGRVFAPEEAAGSAISPVILGHDVWQTRFGGDPAVLGQRLDVGGAPAVVIGVMPEGFAFPLRQEYWQPLEPRILDRWSGARRPPLQAFGRLRDGVTAAAAAAELDALADRAAESVGGEAVETRVRSFAAAYTDGSHGPLAMMLGAALGVLVLGCLNVVHLGLARGLERARELAIRSALGASRTSLIFKLLTESLLLGLLGGGVGLGVALAAIELFRASGGLSPLFWVDVRLDGRSLAAALAVTGIAVALPGMLLSLRPSGIDPVRTLQHRTAGMISGRWSKVCVITQVALSAAALVCTLLMVESVAHLESSDVGADPEKVWTALIIPSGAAYAAPADRQAFFESLRREVEALPQVRSAALTMNLPASETPASRLEAEGQGVELATEVRARWSVVGLGFFELLGRPPLQGRTFLVTDDAESERVTVINAALAARHFPGMDPIGKRIRQVGVNGPGEWLHVVGVVPNLFLDWNFFSEWIGSGRPSGLYLPRAQSPQFAFSLVARCEGSAEALTPEVRRILNELDPNLPLMLPRSMEAALAEASQRYRMIRNALSAFGGVALILSVIGLYAVTSFTVGLRQHEFGVRAAFGAHPADLASSVLRTGLAQVGWGILLGLGMGALLTRTIRSALFGVEPSNPVTFLAVAVVLLVPALAASALPALRAARTDPAEILWRD